MIITQISLPDPNTNKFMKLQFWNFKPQNQYHNEFRHHTNNLNPNKPNQVNVNFPEPISMSVYTHYSRQNFNNHNYQQNQNNFKTNKPFRIPEKSINLSDLPVEIFVKLTLILMILIAQITRKTVIILSTLEMLIIRNFRAEFMNMAH